MASKKIEKAIDVIFVVIASVCKVMLLFMACTVTAQVVVRACGGNISWCEEIMLFMLDGMMFLLLPIGIKDDLHIRIEVFAKHFPRKMRIAMVYASDVIMLLVSLCMVYFGIILQNKTYSKLTVTGIPRKYLYLFTVVSGVLSSIVLLAKLCGLFKTNSTVCFIEGIDEQSDDGKEEKRI